jgi:hypothetical protein
MHMSSDHPLSSAPSAFLPKHGCALALLRGEERGWVGGEGCAALAVRVGAHMWTKCVGARQTGSGEGDLWSLPSPLPTRARGNMPLPPHPHSRPPAQSPTLYPLAHLRQLARHFLWLLPTHERGERHVSPERQTHHARLDLGDALTRRQQAGSVRGGDAAEDGGGGVHGLEAG